MRPSGFKRLVLTTLTIFSFTLVSVTLPSRRADAAAIGFFAPAGGAVVAGVILAGAGLGLALLGSVMYNQNSSLHCRETKSMPESKQDFICFTMEMMVKFGGAAIGMGLLLPVEGGVGELRIMDEKTAHIAKASELQRLAFNDELPQINAIIRTQAHDIAAAQPKTVEATLEMSVKFWESQRELLSPEAYQAVGLMSALVLQQK